MKWINLLKKIGVKDKKNQSMSKLIFNLSLNKNYIELALSISLVQRSVRL